MDAPWVRYALEGFPVGLWIDGRTIEDPTLPMVFVFDRPEDVPAGPRHGGYPRGLLEHATGSTRIESVVLRGPGLGRAPELPLPDTVRLREAETWTMQLELDGTLEHTKVSPLLELANRPFRATE